MTSEAQQGLLYEMVKMDLAAPKVLLEQVTDYIRDHYNYSGETMTTFFAEKYPQLEDYEIDLTFSPQFTPGESNRLQYMPVLGAKSLSPAEVSALAQRLCADNIEASFSTPDEQVSVTIPLREVMIERYVKLLKLDHGVDETVYAAIESQVPEDAWNTMNLLARDDVWQSRERQQILKAFLKVFKDRGSFTSEKMRFLTDFMRTYRPGSLLDLDRQLASLIQSCESDMENIKSRGFHDEYIKAMNAGNVLAGAGEEQVWKHYNHMMEMSRQLLEDYHQLAEMMPEYLESLRQQHSQVS